MLDTRHSICREGHQVHMEKIIVDNGQNFDFGKTSTEYAKYRDIYPKELYDRLYAIGIGKEGSRWLDLGTGTGVIPRGLAEHGADIVATDISAEQIEEAKKLSEGFYNITYKVSSAEEIDYPDNSFDVITACQCFWYFEPSIIVPKIKQLLKQGGIFLKLYMSYLKDDPIAMQSHALVKELNPNWIGGSAAVQDLRTHYFPEPQMENFIIELPFTQADWHGRMMASRGVLASMDEDTVKIFEDRHLSLLSTQPEAFTIKHKVFLTYYYM